MLEALLKRVDGLEKRLQDEKNPISPTSPDCTEDLPLAPPTRRNTIDASFHAYSSNDHQPILSTPVPVKSESLTRSTGHPPSPAISQPQSAHPHPQSQSHSQPHNAILSDVLLDTFFTRLHGKPFFILDEAQTRRLHNMKQLSVPLSMAISAMTSR